MAILHRMTLVCTDVCLSAFFPEKLERPLENSEVTLCKPWENCILLCSSLLTITCKLSRQSTTIVMK